MIISQRKRQKKYTDNDMHENIDPKIQNMKKIQVPRMNLHEGVLKNIQGVLVTELQNIFWWVCKVQFDEKCTNIYFI